MPRHPRRRYHYGGSSNYSSNNGGGGGAALHYHRDHNQVYRCSHCDTLLPRSRFPKSVRDRFNKRLARGDHPTTINAICFNCCDTPNNGSPSASASDTHPPPPAASMQQRRARCTDCRLEYPLTRTFFTKHDIRLDRADRRVCFSCRNNKHMDEAIDDAIDAGLEPVQDQHAATPHQDKFVPYDSDHDDDAHAAPLDAWEDLPSDHRARLLNARNDFGNLAIRAVSALSLVQRRRRMRFVTSRELLRRHRLERARQQIAALRIAATSRQEIAKRNAFFGRAYQYGIDLVPEHPDAHDLLSLVGEIDPQIVQYEYDDVEPIHAPDDFDHDRRPIWHLTERERLDRIRHRCESKLDLSAAPQQQFRPEHVQILAQQDSLIQRFQRCLTIAAESPSPSCESAPTTFRMTYLLNALDAETQSRATTAASTAAASLAQASAKRFKTVKFQR